MSEFKERLARGPELAAMIHLPALPGTPRSALDPAQIVERAVAEALLYREGGITTVVLENMHDVPYVRTAGPEVVATMTAAARAVKQLGGLYCGVQVLAGNNREAVAVAHAAGLDFIRVEGFVFAHVGDEGWHDACAGELLRYRRSIGAEAVLVFADIKKKHASHAVTADLDLAATARAAAFFGADGVVVTGPETGEPVNLEDLDAVGDPGIPVAVGSGITPAQLPDLLPRARLLIAGSWLKEDGTWHNAPSPIRIRQMAETFRTLLE